MKIENLKFKILFICLLAYWIIGLFPSATFAATSADDNWSIDIKDIKINSTLPTPMVKPDDNSNEKALKENPDLYTSSFSFGISNSLIDFGILSPTNPIYRTTNISLSGSLKNFIVLAYEDDPLTAADSKIFIPDTTCDNGSCSDVLPGPWENTLTFGFGYRCNNVTGNACSPDMSTDNFYKNFSDSSKNKLPSIIMSNEVNPQTPESQITYKLNISKTQPPGSYTNTITYIAVPGY